LAGFAGSVWYSISPARRRDALPNYAAVLELPPEHPEVHRVMRCAFANYGRMLADFLLMGSVDPKKVHELVSIEGRANVDAAAALGRGVILAMPHMGSWDVAGPLAPMHGYRLLAVADPFPGTLDEAVHETRAAHGLEIAPFGRSAVRRINEALDRHSLVALLCDLPHGPGVEVELFGKRATVPSGPAAIALKRGTPLLPACAWRSGLSGYQVVIEGPIAPPAAGDGRGRDAVTAMMQALVRRFEVFIRAHPEHWYAFRSILR
jgi:KDO2-lipid IV(A) lauroyltransferase